MFLCLFKWGQCLLSPRRLWWKATLQRLRSWLTWTYVTLLLQSFSTECLLKITITDTQGGYDKFSTEVIFSNLDVYSFLCVVTNNTDLCSVKEQFNWNDEATKSQLFTVYCDGLCGSSGLFMGLVEDVLHTIWKANGFPWEGKQACNLHLQWDKKKKKSSGKTDEWSLD